MPMIPVVTENGVPIYYRLLGPCIGCNEEWFDTFSRRNCNAAGEASESNEPIPGKHNTTTELRPSLKLGSLIQNHSC